MSLSVVCFKWSPFEDQVFSIPSQEIIQYTSEHVNTLYSMVSRHLHMPFEMVCVTDDPTGIHPDIRIVPLWDKFRKLGGCYNRLYTFSRDMESILGPRFICLDMDLVLVADITPLLQRDEDFVFYKMRGPQGLRLNGGMFMMNAGAREFVWTDFESNPADAIAQSEYIVGTDQAWMQHRLGLEEPCWTLEDGIYDMRMDFLETGMKDIPMDARIIMWPGPRDPSHQEWREAYPWIESNYK